MTIVLIFFPYLSNRTQFEAAEIIIVSWSSAIFLDLLDSYMTQAEHGKAFFVDQWFTDQFAGAAPYTD